MRPATIAKNVVNRLLRPLSLELRRRPLRKPTPTVDAAEIAAVEAVLGRFAATRPSGSELADARALRDYLSDERIAFFHDLVEATAAMGVRLDGARVADLGSGTGYLLRRVGQAHVPARLVGADSFTEMNEMARLLCPEAEIEDASLFEVEGPFDVVYCTEVLEHLVDPAAAVCHLVSCLAPGGALVLTVPDGRRDQHPALDAREDGTAYWGHIHFWSPESWPLFLREAVGDDAEIQTGRLMTEKNLAVVRP